MPADIETICPSLISSSKGQQFPLRIGKTASCGDTPEPVRHFPVMRPGLAKPSVLVGGEILHRAFTRYTRLWRAQCKRVFV